MNIQTREQFDLLLAELYAVGTDEPVVVDTETNGLSVYQGNRPISMSFYFPVTDRSFNFAWAHGQGIISIPEANQDTTKFHQWNWQGNGKRQVWKAYWFDLYRSLHANDFQNCPTEWLDELREAWNNHVAQTATVVYFNAPFDIHMMEAIGFNAPTVTEDVRIAVSLVFEDFLHPSINVGNGLKPQAAYHGIEGALDGETELRTQAEQLSQRVAELIVSQWDDQINGSFHKLKRPATVDEVAQRLRFDAKSEMWCLPSGAVSQYAENDVVITWRLREKLVGYLNQWEQFTLYNDLCDMQNEFLIRMERNGVMLDKERAEELYEEMTPIMDEVNAWFAERLEPALDALDEDVRINYEFAANDFTCGSPKKLAAALTVITGYEWESTDKEAIQAYEDYVGEHEAVEQLKRYRHAQRAVRTYLRNWMKSQDEHGFIHGSFNASGTKTGRLSSSSGTLGEVGNFQNIPSRGFNLKECLVAPPGWEMFQIDYGQLELRLASWIAGCDTMIEMFETGADLHAYTRDQAGIGAILHGTHSVMDAANAAFHAGKLKHEPVDLETAKDELQTYYRQVAKTLNFGLLYGGTWRMVDRLLRVGEDKARELHAAWNALYPEFAEANAQWTADALTRRPRPDGTGAELFVRQPISGRTRKFKLYPRIEDAYDPKTGERWVNKTREQQAKDAFNFAVQGLGGYIMTMSSLRMCREFSNDIFRPFANIHDSIVFYVREGHLDILPRMVEIMTDWDVRPSLTVDVEHATDGTWQNLKSIKDLDAFIHEGAIV